MLRRAPLLALLLAAALACGQDEGRASPPAGLAPAESELPAVAAPATPDPERASPEAALAAAQEPSPPARPAARTREEAPLAAAPGEGTPPPALEDLLRLPASSAPTTRDPLADLPPPPPDASPEERAAWRERVRLERRSSEIGPAGPRQGSYSETDASLRLPVSDRVQLEGGVRVNQRDEPGRESQEGDRGSSSRVGVEVKF